MNNSNLPLAIVLSIAILVGFQFFYVKPQQDTIQQQAQTERLIKQVAAPTAAATSPASLRDRSLVLKDSPRLPIATPELNGSLNLKGARLDDLSMTRHKASVAPDAPPVVLLSPSGSASPHKAAYAEFSWLAEDESTPLPTSQSLWRADGKELTPSHPVKLIWANEQGLVFEREIAVDDKAMFTITDRVRNTGKTAVKLYPFGLAARQGIPDDHDSSKISHEGPLGVLNGVLNEHAYDKMQELKRLAVESEESGWVGIAAKYWLVALIPPTDQKLTASFAYNANDPVGTDNNTGHYQVDFRGPPITIEPGASATRSTRLFAGVKNAEWLDSYRETFGIKNFDRAIDYGRVFWLPIYFLAKPFLYLLDGMVKMFGNIGLAILAFTVLLKLVTLPLSLKSYHSMARMKALQPETKRLQERFADDKLRLNQELMELYKRERVNPMSGCLPVLVQIPIFFALYAVLNVDIAMRQAPFYGWIKDMSMPDPTTLFNLFGLIPWTPPQALQIGAWPLLMGATMFLQQKLSPQPPDKTQARIFLLMPILFTYMFAHMPSGLVIYWTWSNLLSIVQQWFIMRKDAKEAKG
ncbi:MAG: membrane protein insertase YidC [Bdellovibrionales bacterium]